MLSSERMGMSSGSLSSCERQASNTVNKRKKLIVLKLNKDYAKEVECKEGGRERGREGKTGRKKGIDRGGGGLECNNEREGERVHKMHKMHVLTKVRNGCISGEVLDADGMRLNLKPFICQRS